jgi:hypothetical protein
LEANNISATSSTMHQTCNDIDKKLREEQKILEYDEDDVNSY